MWAVPRGRGDHRTALPPRAYPDRTGVDQADFGPRPRMQHRVRDWIEKTVTDLDVDLADWYDETTTRPRVSVHGPIHVPLGAGLSLGSRHQQSRRFRPEINPGTALANVVPGIPAGREWIRHGRIPTVFPA